MAFPFADDPFEFQNQLFSGQPEAAFFSAIPQGLSRGRERQYRDLFRDVHTDYLEALGRQIRSGQMPTLQEGSFFGNYDFAGRLAGMTPREKGLEQSRFAPFTRWVF